MSCFRYIRYVLLAAMVLAAGVEAAQEVDRQQVATLDDGQQRRGRLQRTDGGRFVFESGKASIPLRRVVRVEFPGTTQLRDGAAPFRVALWGAEHLSVDAVRLDGQSARLVWRDQTELPIDRRVLCAISTGAGAVRTGLRRLDTSQDQILLTEGDELFGDVSAIDASGCTFLGAFPATKFAWEEVRQVRLRRTRVRGRNVRGLFVRLHLRNNARSEDDDVLQGALQQIGAEDLTLDHPHLGRFRVPRRRVRTAEILGQGLRVDVESAEQHLGNDVRAELLLPVPDGTELVRTFTLDSLPVEPAAVVCNVVQLESAQRGGRFARDLNEGDLRTNLWINDRLVDYMNRYVARPIDEPQWLRIAVPHSALKRGTNTLRISQTPLPDDKSDFDDFMMANLAIEFSESSR